MEYEADAQSTYRGHGHLNTEAVEEQPHVQPEEAEEGEVKFLSVR